MPQTRFDDLPPTPAEHLKLWLFAAVHRLLDRAAQAFGSFSAAASQFPFLNGYAEELHRRGFTELGLAAEENWLADLATWEEAHAGHLPIRAIRRVGKLSATAIRLWMTVGLPEEDARFGLLFDALQGTPGGRPTPGLLHSLWQESTGHSDPRADLRRLQGLGVVQTAPADRGTPAGLFPAPLLWDAARGEWHAAPVPWVQLRSVEELPALQDLILNDQVRECVGRLPALLQSGRVNAVAVRGPHANGRSTLIGSVARLLGRGVVKIRLAPQPDAEALRTLGPLATMSNALPVVALNLGPGETAELPALTGYDGPLGVILGRHGAVSGPAVEGLVTVELPPPDRAARAAHWRQGLGDACGPDLDEIAARNRMTGGNIRRAAGLARAEAALAGRAQVTLADARRAARALAGPALGATARRVEASGNWSHLAAGRETLRELASLEARCRHRESLPGEVGGALGGRLSAGVRAMFSGPSGTGKTLAAGVLAASLGIEMYRVDLAAVVSKYIGETEKSLDLLFARAEELDVILLLDEGDALLTQRTGVQSSTDRYANLETNFLLQRIEDYEGILLVTTNAAERIDSAFMRRMDVVVEFRPPDPAERWAIWQTHLPERHAIDPEALREVAVRCSLTGGQIRNAVLHAALLARELDAPVATESLFAAVQREYRKSGSVCPLRPGR